MCAYAAIVLLLATMEPQLSELEPVLQRASGSGVPDKEPAEAIEPLLSVEGTPSPSPSLSLGQLPHDVDGIEYEITTVLGSQAWGFRPPEPQALSRVASGEGRVSKPAPRRRRRKERMTREARAEQYSRDLATIDVWVAKAHNNPEFARQMVTRVTLGEDKDAKDLCPCCERLRDRHVLCFRYGSEVRVCKSTLPWLADRCPCSRARNPHDVQCLTRAMWHRC